LTEGRIEHVSDTAFLVARYRAIETERPDALFRDPLAARLAGDRGRAIVARLPRRASFGRWSVAIRTVLIDDYVRAAVKNGVTQVINLGAGLDTRPYRLELPSSLTWVEIDFPQVIELKEQQLASERPSCRLERIKLDLTDRSARRQALLALNARGGRCLVLTEGVVPYLSNDEVASLAEDLRAEPHMALWVVDYFSPKVLARRVERPGMKNAPFRFAPEDWAGFFEAHGWRVVEIRYLAEEARRLGRRRPASPSQWISRLRRLFLSAKRREALGRFAGFALLART
jgi:methyltransferase (TIGR00027 family)